MATWEKIPPAPELIRASLGSSIVWDGEAFLVWGGVRHDSQEHMASGAAYHADAHRWSVIPAAPVAPRANQTAVWTGREMIVWGGTPYDASTHQECTSDSGDLMCANDGAGYNPSTGAWRKITTAPIKGRTQHVAVWTGKRMIVFGGYISGDSSSQGASYDPTLDRWEALPTAPISADRFNASATWTGREMIIWGGEFGQNGGVRDDGAAYDPAMHKWRALPAFPFPKRAVTSVVWTGDHFIAWGGSKAQSSDPTRGDGAEYSPTADVWRVIAKAPAPPDGGTAATSFEGKMLIWTNFSHDGARLTPINGYSFDPVAGAWSHVPSPSPQAWERYKGVPIASSPERLLLWTAAPAVYSRFGPA